MGGGGRACAIFFSFGHMHSTYISILSLSWRAAESKNTLSLAAVASVLRQTSNTGEVPVNELVLLQVLAALSNVSRHVEEVHHGQTGRVLLFTWRQNLILAATTGKKKKSEACCSSNLDHKGVEKNPCAASHQPGSGLPQERLQVSTGHQLQQDEPGHGLQTHSHAAHNVLVAEFTAERRARQGSVLQKSCFLQIRVWSSFRLNKS